MTKEQQYWEDVQKALDRIFDLCEEIDPKSGYKMIKDCQLVRGFVNKHRPQESEDEKVIRLKKGTLKARTGRYVIYDVEWLKTHFNTTEAKIYGQPNERTETHACDCANIEQIIRSTIKEYIDKDYSDKVDLLLSLNKDLCERIRKND